MGSGPSKADETARADRECKSRQDKENEAARARKDAEEEQGKRQQVEQKLKELVMKQQMENQKREDVDKKVRELREKVKGMKPGDTMPYFDETDFPKKLLVGIYGTSGIGKTSLMNSIKYSVEEGGIDRNLWFQSAAAEFQGGHTMRRRKLPMTKNLWFVDTRGFVTEDLEKDDALKEMINQLEGRGSFAREVVWTGNDFEQDKQAKVKEQNKIFCTILVFSAKGVETIKPVIKKFVRVLFKWQGRYPLAVITHAESATPEQVNTARFLLLSSGLSDIYEVENVNEADKNKPKHDLEPKYQLVLLKLLERCMVDGDAIFQMRYEMDEENRSQEDSINIGTISSPD